MTTLAGISVSRAIPESALIGLLSGGYSLQGGVVRDMGGRIVAHMALPTPMKAAVSGPSWVEDAFKTFRLENTGLALERVEIQVGAILKSSTDATALSGLGPVVSVGGFAFLSRKLDELNLTLGRIEQNSQQATQFRESMQHSQLEAAVVDLRHAIETTDSNTRHAYLMSSKNEFGRLIPQYARLLSKLNDLNELQSIDDGYLIAMIGRAQATSDLGMSQVALDDFTTNRLAWQNLARELCRSKSLKKEPQRLLHHRFLASMPTISLIKLLDFVHQTPKGAEWLDELRKMESEASILRLPKFGSEDDELAFARKLVARDEVLSGFQSHLKFLHQHDIRSCDFQAKVKELIDAQTGSEPLWITHAEPILSKRPPKATTPTPPPQTGQASPTLLGRIKNLFGLRALTRQT